MERQACLWYVFDACVVVVAHPEPRIQAQPVPQVLAEIDVACKLVEYGVHELGAGKVEHVFVGRVAARAEVVEAECGAVAFVQAHALVGRYAQHHVVGTETVVQRGFARVMAVVYVVFAPRVENA